MYVGSVPTTACMYIHTSSRERVARLPCGYGYVHACLDDFLTPVQSRAAKNSVSAQNTGWAVPRANAWQVAQYSRLARDALESYRGPANTEVAR